jgi:hypothetical protein
MSIGNFFLKQLLKSKMKGVPEADQQRIFNALDKNPQFFQKIAEEVQVKVKSGKGQQEAVMEVLSKHQDELKRIMG